MATKRKSGVRDTWIPETWRYRGAGFQKSKKKELPRKAKHKQKYIQYIEVRIVKLLETRLNTHMYQTQYLESKDVSETN